MGRRAKKPQCNLQDANGNMTAALAIASRTLMNAKLFDKNTEMRSRVFKAMSYESAIAIILEYVSQTKQ